MVKHLMIRSFKGNLVLEVLLRAKNLFILPILTRYLGTAEYGKLALVLSLAGLVGSVSTLGLPSALARYLPAAKTSEQKAKILWPAMVSLIISIGAFLIVAVIVVLGTSSFWESLPRDLLIVGGVSVLSNEVKVQFFNFHRITLDVGRYYRWVTADLVLTTGAQLLAVLWLATDVAGVLLASVVVDFLLIAALVIPLNRQVPWVRPRMIHLRPLYAFGLPLMANNLLNWINNSVDRIFVEASGSSSDVGVYSLGYMLGFSAVSLIAAPIFAVLPSILFRMWDSGETDRSNQVLITVGSFLVAAMVPALLTLHFFGDPFIKLVAGEGFAGAQQFVLLVGAGYAMMYFSDLYGYPLLLRNRQFSYPVALTIGAVVNLLTNFLLVARLGAIGAAYATLLSFAALATTLMVFNRRFACPSPSLLRPIALAILGGCVWISFRALLGVASTVTETMLFGGGATLLFLALALVTNLLPRAQTMGLIKQIGRRT